MKRQNRKTGRKILKDILRAIIIILLLFMIFGYVHDLSNENAILINKARQDDIRIEQLEAKNASLESKNERLAKAVVYQYNKINDLNTQPVKEIQHKQVPKIVNIHTHKKDNSLTDVDAIIGAGAITTTATMIMILKAIFTTPVIPL